jgi:hypothetical protein
MTMQPGLTRSPLRLFDSHFPLADAQRSPEKVQRNDSPSGMKLASRKKASAALALGLNPSSAGSSGDTIALEGYLAHAFVTFCDGTATKARIGYITGNGIPPLVILPCEAPSNQHSGGRRDIFAE